MKRLLWAIPILLLLAGAFLLSGAYSYYYTATLYPSLPSDNWTYSGNLSSNGSSGMSGSGTMIGTGFSTSDGEIKVTMPSGLPYGSRFALYFRASADANAYSYPASGTYYAASVNCYYGYGTYDWNTLLNLVERSSNGSTQYLASVWIPWCFGSGATSLRVAQQMIGSTLRIRVYQNDTLVLTYDDSAPLSGGYMGVGGFSVPLTDTINLGYADTSPPNAIPASSITKAAYLNHIDFTWPATTDTGSPESGVYGYELWRDGSLLGTTRDLRFSDTTVELGITYNYELRPVDYHGNHASSGSFAVTAAVPDGRRTGVRSTGAYWGAGGENIDVLSGNLNFTLPALTAQARGGWSAGFSLNYNSQLWRNDTSSNWKYGYDAGYGFGWKLMAGSVIPVYSDLYTISHYLFTDSTGAEYRLDQNANGIWTSKDSVYVYFDVSQSKLHFRDGSFWYFNCISATGEPDSGTMYPTLMQDSNGNQILIRYMTSPGSSLADSSARIKEIEDVRAQDQGGGVFKTFAFTYNSDAPVPHLTSISNTIGTGENYAFTYLTGQSLYSPFNSAYFGVTAFLRRIDVSGIYAHHEMSYNGSGELTQVLLPHQGKLSYDYTTATYSNSLATQYREVQYRYLWKDGSSSTQYAFSHESSPGPFIHSFTQLNDPGGVGQKYWEFGQSGVSTSLVTRYEGRQLPGPVVKVRNDFTWVRDAAVKNAYISTVIKTADPTQTYEAVSKTTQTVDNYGNVTEVKQYNYGNLVNPYHTSTYTYLGQSANQYINQPYLDRYIFNRMLTGPGVSISYDNSYNAVSGTPRLWDSSMQYDQNRGNPKIVTSSGAPTKTMDYNVLGVMISAVSNGITTSVTTDSNYVVPTQITTGSFTSTAAYNSFLGLTNETGPNNVSVSMGYDSLARPSTTTTATGATVTYSYNTYDYPNTTKTTVNGHWTRTSVDGLGRTIKTEAGQGTTTETVADVEYDSCGCSPTGKMKRTSLPHAPGATPVWTTYTYDGIGRTLSVVTAGTETTGTTTYVYQGNTVTVTDPAGKWKKYTSDVLGELVQVNEPEPSGGSDYVTTYTYDYWGHLTGVNMPRPTGTQTRSWAYNSSLQLTSMTNPENGTVSFAYNSDRTLASKTDAKGQQVQFSYDSYKRVTEVRKYVSGTEDTCQREDYYFDSQSFASGFAQNALGRLAAVVYRGGVTPCNYTFTEMLSYNSAGEPTAKRLRRQPDGGNASDLDSAYGYDNEGRMTSLQYPQVWNGSAWVTGPSLTNVFDNMGRLQGLQEGTNDVITSATYNPAGQLTAMTGANGAPSESRTYNSIGQMTRLTVPSGIDIEYKYPSTLNNGKISSEKDWHSGEEVAYLYDSLNRLQSAATLDPSGWGQSYTYDGFGNLTQQNVTQGSAPPLSVTYNASTNRRTDDCADANGNINSAPCSGGYTYDVSNRIVGVPGGTYYSYAPNNQRVYRYSSATGNELTYYGATGQKLAVYSLDNANPTATYYYFGGKLVKNQGGYVTPDRLGSIGKYFPYGNERPSATANNKEKFATYYRDSETGLDYAQDRYHQVGMGRFMTPDRKSGGTHDPGSLNKYAYTGGDPVNRTDPGGMQSEGAPDIADYCWAYFSCGGDGQMGSCIWMYGGQVCDERGVEFLMAECLSQGGDCGFGPAPEPEAPPDVETAGGSAPTSVSGASGFSDNPWSGVASAISGTQCETWLQGGLDKSVYKSAGSVNNFLTNPGLLLAGTGSADFNGGTAQAINVGSTLPGGDGFVILFRNGGFYFKPNPDASLPSGNVVFSRQIGAIQGGTPQAQAFLLLHELGHFLGLFQSDNGSDKAQRDNNDLMWSNCAGVILGFPNKVP